jgi:TRAP-type mannitol/chloroaromatic compound transport system permease small subunit
MAEMVQTSYKRGVTAYTVSETPLWMPQALILLGLAILTLQVLAYLLYLLVHGPGTVEPGEVKI